MEKEDMNIVESSIEDDFISLSRQGAIGEIENL
jgi:hypothetical protein